MLFSDFVPLWIREYAEKNMEPRTLHECLTKLNYRIIPYFGKYQLSQIRSLTVTIFINRLADTVIDSKTKRKLSAQTILHYHRLLSSMFVTAIRWDLMMANPCSKVVKPKVPNLEMKMLDELESQLLLTELVNAPLKHQCIIYIAIMTGLRNGEILALKWSDIDFSKKEISVNRARSYVPGIGSFDKVPKTLTSKRCLAVSQVVLDKLSTLAKDQELQKANLGENGRI